MKLEEDEISKYLRKERERIALRFSKYYLILCGLYGIVRLLHWLLDFPASLSLLNALSVGIVAALFFNAAGLFGETFILEFRLRSQSVQHKLSNLESQLALMMKPTEEREPAHGEEDGDLLAKYRASAERGEVWGQHNLGVAYSNGVRLPRDYAMAAYWYRKAAEQNDEGSMMYLADIYRRGEGIKRDMPEAISLYRSVSHSSGWWGSVAAGNLGEIYASEEAGKPDYFAANGWWELSAQRGWAWASSYLGEMYLEGNQTISNNLDDAYFWFCVTLHSHPSDYLKEKTMKARDDLASQFESGHLQKIQERIQQWLDTYRAKWRTEAA